MSRKETIANDKHKSRKKPAGRSWFRRLFHIVISTPVRQVILLAIILALLFWQSQNILDVAENLVNMFGWGLVFIAAAIIVLVVQIKRRQLASFIFHWHRWLGGIVFILAVWGILAFPPAVAC